MAAEPELKRVESSDPPDITRFELETLVDLHANERGLPEATLQMPTGPRTVPITPLAAKRR